MKQTLREAIGKAVYDADPYSKNPLATPWEHLGASQELDIARGMAAVRKYQEMQPRIPFSNQEHLDRFLEAIQRIGKIYETDKIDFEYGAALYILTSADWLIESASKYMSSRGIRFDLILKNVHLSGGYTVLVEFAANLFGHDIHVDPIQLMRLDENNFTSAKIALDFRFYGAIHAIRLGDLEVVE